MEQLSLSVQEIKELIAAFSKGGLGGLKIEQGDFKLELKGVKVEQVVVSAPAGTLTPVGAAPAGGAAPAAPVEAPAYRGNVVTSPIVGTFYAAPGPDKDPYVRVGSKVCKGDVLFIIESMKLMNEVTSDVDGTVAEILVENAQGVEYGQPILCIE